MEALEAYQGPNNSALSNKFPSSKLSLPSTCFKKNFTRDSIYGELV